MVAVVAVVVNIVEQLVQHIFVVVVVVVLPNNTKNYKIILKHFPCTWVYLKIFEQIAIFLALCLYVNVIYEMLFMILFSY